MRIIRFTSYLFYKYYSKDKGRTAIPIANTVVAMSMLFILHVFLVLVLTNTMGALPSIDKQHRVKTFINGLLLVLPILLVFWGLVKKLKLDQVSYEDRVIKRGYIYLISYIVILFSILVVISYLKYKK